MHRGPWTLTGPDRAARHDKPSHTRHRTTRSGQQPSEVCSTHTCTGFTTPARPLCARFDKDPGTRSRQHMHSLDEGAPPSRLCALLCVCVWKCMWRGGERVDERL